MTKLGVEKPTWSDAANAKGPVRQWPLGYPDKAKYSPRGQCGATPMSYALICQSGPFRTHSAGA